MPQRNWCFPELLAVLDTVPHKDFHSYSLRSLKTAKKEWPLLHSVVKVKYIYPSLNSSFTNTFSDLFWTYSYAPVNNESEVTINFCLKIT